MSNKRIGLYLSSYSGGGAEREMIYLANEFAARGYHVDLIIHRDSGPLTSLVDPAVNQIVIDKTYLHNIFVLARYMRVARPLFVLSTLHIPNWTLSLAKFCSFTKTKISWRIVTSLSYSQQDIKSKINSFHNILYPVLSRNVDKIVCVSNGVAQDLVSNFSINKNQIQLLYNPAYTKTIHSMAEEKISHKWLNGEFNTVVALGRLSSEKDFKTLIKSFKIVHKEIEKAKLIIFGEGALRSDLQYLIDEYELENVVELFGFELNPYKYLAKANLFVLSSVYEGFGNVIVEALALNVPVVSTDCPSGPAEILENGKWGKLVPVGDSRAMANAIVDSLSSPPTQGTLCRARDFSVEKVVDGYLRMML